MPLDRLFTQFQLGPLTLKNRFALAPSATGAERIADISTLRDFYAERAAADVAMITVYGGIVHWTGKRFTNERQFDEQLDVTRHRLITTALHNNHCAAVLQLVHAGLDARSPWVISSSATYATKTAKRTIACPSFFIKHLISGYEKTARLACEANYDGVEIDASSLSLLSSFTSPAVNKRKDQWGRNQLARFKLSLDVVRVIRKQIGSSKLIGYRLNLLELSPKGADWSETTRLIQMLRMAGVNYFCANFGLDSTRIPTDIALTPPEVWTPYYGILARTTDLPVFFGKDHLSAEQMEQLSMTYENALFELKEPLIADAQCVSKIQSKCQDSIVTCLRCSCCNRINDRSELSPIFCPANLFLFKNTETIVSAAPKRKSILVIGAGVAGIVFSLISSRRGHKVTLAEENETIGGQIALMANIPHKERWRIWLEQMERNLISAGVTICTGREVTLSSIMEGPTYDEIIIATGSEPLLPDIAGIDSSNVVTYEEYLNKSIGVGNRVAVLGNNTLAMDVAAALVQPGKTSGSEDEGQTWRNLWGLGDIRQNRAGIVGFIPQIENPLRTVYLFDSESSVRSSSEYVNWQCQWLRIMGVQTFQDINFEMIDNYSLRVSFGTQHKNPMPIRIDHVVVCWGQVPNSDLAMRLETAGFSIRKLGAVTRTSGFISITQAIESAMSLAASM